MPRRYKGDEDFKQLVFYPTNEGLECFIPGHLEALVMNILWDLHEENDRKRKNKINIGISEVDKVLAERYKQLRYTSVANVLNRLAYKGIVKKVEGKIHNHQCFWYVPKYTREEYLRRMIHTILNRILEQYKIHLTAWLLLNIGEWDDVTY